MNTRELFLKHNAQTSTSPLAIEISAAQGCYLFGPKGEKYLDLIGGISVCNLGHGNKKIIEAIQAQSEKYLHVMVYGETIQSPQVQFAKILTEHLAPNLNSIYFTNSGSEATEGAMKLAKRYTGKSKIISFKNSYHGSSQGALSIMGSEYWQEAFRPLLPNIFQYDYGSEDVFEQIDEDCACVVMELIQAEAGVWSASKTWLQKIKERCERSNTLLVVDEIQSGFGRCGSLFYYEQLQIVPDILLLGKALGGGLPMGAFIADKKIMDSLAHNPVLGHITTFGGHPLCCAAGLASFDALQNLFNEDKNFVNIKSQRFTTQLQHPAIKKIQAQGLLIALHFESYEINKKIIDQCIYNGLFTDWFLFAPQALRIAPPLTITMDEIDAACVIIVKSINEIMHA